MVLGETDVSEWAITNSGTAWSGKCHFDANEVVKYIDLDATYKNTDWWDDEGRADATLNASGSQAAPATLNVSGTTCQS